MQGVMGHAQFIRQLGIIIGRAKFQALYIQVISQNVLRIFIDSRHILGIYLGTRKTSPPPSFCHRTKTNCNSEFEEWQRWWCIMCNLGVVSLNLQWYLYRRWAKLNRSRFLTESRVGSWFFRTHYTFKWNKDVIIVFNHKAEPIKSQKKFWIFCASAEMASFAELWAKSVQISSR